MLETDKTKPNETKGKKNGGERNRKNKKQEKFLLPESKSFSDSALPPLPLHLHLRVPPYSPPTISRDEKATENDSFVPE